MMTHLKRFFFFYPVFFSAYCTISFIVFSCGKLAAVYFSLSFLASFKSPLPQQVTLHCRMTLALFRSSGTFSRPSFYLRASLTVWDRCETSGLQTQEERHSAVMRVASASSTGFPNGSVGSTEQARRARAGDKREAREGYDGNELTRITPKRWSRRLETRLTSPALLWIVLPRGAS